MLAHAKALPALALATVADILGAPNADEALAGLARLSTADLQRLRASRDRMGL